MSPREKGEGEETILLEVACIGADRGDDSSSDEEGENEAARQSLEAERELAQVLAT